MTTSVQSIQFTKMHGLGNDYVYVNCLQRELEQPQELARLISDRHRGVGSDGLILICPPHKGVDAHVRMRMFNADGNESGMCGNGVRCVCKYVVDRGLARGWPLRIQTGGGIVSMEYVTDETGRVAQVSVDMGPPRTALAEIPVQEQKLGGPAGTSAWLVKLGRESFAATFVSMGNPHAVVFLDDAVDGFDVPAVGAAMERHPAFPQRTNVHLVQVLSRNEVKMRTWERGSGLTQACGSGACAVCAAGVLTSRTEREITAHLPGGDLHVRWDERSGHIIMTGPAVQVFEGEWRVEQHAAASASQRSHRVQPVIGTGARSV